jgi:antitoxin ParD1/3/4
MAALFRCTQSAPYLAIICHLRHIRSMDSMNISLPHRLKAWIEGQVAEGRYSSASEYVRELIRADEKAKAQAKLEDLLLEGLKGEATEWTEADSDALLRLAATGR